MSSKIGDPRTSSRLQVSKEFAKKIEVREKLAFANFGKLVNKTHEKCRLVEKRNMVVIGTN